jgi:hypothetical protein
MKITSRQEFAASIGNSHVLLFPCWLCKQGKPEPIMGKIEIDRQARSWKQQRILPIPNLTGIKLNPCRSN